MGVAILLGFAAVFLANSYLGRVEQRQANSPQGTVKVAVARVPLEFGAQITADKVRLVDWPAEALPVGTFTSLPQLLPMNHTRVVLRPMTANEPILRSKISGEGGRAAISAVLSPDKRAVAVRVGDVAGVGGFVLPGDVVDVLVTRTPTGPNSGGRQITDVLLQKVRVIAVDQDANDNSDKPAIGKTATLEVAQVDAQKLALAQQVGQLSLALANPAADVTPVVGTVSTEDLRDGAFVAGVADARPRYQPRPVVYTRPPRVARPAAPNPDLATITVVRGTKDSSYEVGSYVGR
ncbi:MAG: Flp pilus assembly protein CpaB [Candidatus Sphingomonas colombiensis]|nr:Flp pilus assembly protein CpaB [Sphingomonas sp.]WEK42513.1 MAG: Flp pilus assembly protein CpaB [Sphingomonas sp.]